MSEPYPISIAKIENGVVCSIDMWRDVQEKIDRFFAERTEEEAVRQLREIGFERVVRCRDCKCCMAYSSATYCDRFAHALPTSELNGFCSWGERRDA